MTLKRIEKFQKGNTLTAFTIVDIGFTTFTLATLVGGVGFVKRVFTKERLEAWESCMATIA